MSIARTYDAIKLRYGKDVGKVITDYLDGPDEFDIMRKKSTLKQLEEAFDHYTFWGCGGLHSKSVLYYLKTEGQDRSAREKILELRLQKKQLRKLGYNWKTYWQY